MSILKLSQHQTKNKCSSVKEEIVTKRKVLSRKTKTGTSYQNKVSTLLEDLPLTEIKKSAEYISATNYRPNI